MSGSGFATFGATTVRIEKIAFITFREPTYPRGFVIALKNSETGIEIEGGQNAELAEAAMVAMLTQLPGFIKLGDILVPVDSVVAIDVELSTAAWQVAVLHENVADENGYISATVESFDTKEEAESAAQKYGRLVTAAADEARQPKVGYYRSLQG